MTATIEFEAVTRHFDGRPVLTGLTFRVEPGEVYALLGRNGAGKTTALNVLLGFLEPMAGTSRVLGVDSRALAPADREAIGYVAEGHPVYELRDVRTTLDFEAGTRARFDRAYAERLLRRLDVPMAARVSRLSRGQRAQLALALALAARPAVLVFDDPALGLDVVARRDLLDAMIELFAEGGTSVLFSTHVMTDVERLADRVGILHGGRLIVDCPLHELRERVRRRALTWPGGDVPSSPPPVAGLVAWRRRRDGYEVVTLDAPPGALEGLPGTARAGEPQVPTVEDLFVDLTAGDDAPELEEVAR